METDHMRGSAVFSRVEPALRLLGTVMGLLPRSAFGFMWELFAIFPGILGVGLRYALLSAFAESLGRNVFVGPRVDILSPGTLSLGDNVSIHATAYIDATGGIQIGDNVSIANHVTIVSTNHSWGQADVPIKYNPLQKDSVTIADDVWVGAGVRVLSGVAIGSRSVVAAGAVVTGPVEAGVLVGGIPARVLKKISHEELGGTTPEDL